MAEAPRVSFLIAGVQKGGTTALFDYLGDAPDKQIPKNYMGPWHALFDRYNDFEGMPHLTKYPELADFFTDRLRGGFRNACSAHNSPCHIFPFRHIVKPL